jgi:hypothetical protein
VIAVLVAIVWIAVVWFALSFPPIMIPKFWHTLVPLPAKETTDSRTRSYREEEQACRYGQPQFPTMKLWAEPYYEDEYSKKWSERDVGLSFFYHGIRVTLSRISSFLLSAVQSLFIPE